jgi:hypothetical protein
MGHFGRIKVRYEQEKQCLIDHMRAPKNFSNRWDMCKSGEVQFLYVLHRCMYRTDAFANPGGESQVVRCACGGAALRVLLSVAPNFTLQMFLSWWYRCTYCCSMTRCLAHLCMLAMCFRSLVISETLKGVGGGDRRVLPGKGPKRG